MDRPLFIGDELTATGFRLPGIRIAAPDFDTLAEVFERGLSEAPLVIITAEMAGRLPGATLADAVRRARPPVAVVPDARGKAPFPDLVRHARKSLGVES